MTASTRRILKFVGGVLLLAGAVLAIDPTLVHDPGPAANSFDAVERRIPWGGLAGLGLLFIAGWRKPMVATIVGIVLWMTVGLIGARLIGILLDGSHPMQWVWVVVEVLVAVIAAVILRRKA